MGRIVIAVDTSASIGNKELAEFQAECQGALDEVQPECLEVVYCDAAINGSEEFQPGDAVRFSAKECTGGGGTSFVPVFDWIEGNPQIAPISADGKNLRPSAKSADAPAALIYLTDGHGCFPKAAPEYPVLWATTDRKEFPFGTVVAVK
jgi:predicted metal-dependent peptidase